MHQPSPVLRALRVFALGLAALTAVAIPRGAPAGVSVTIDLDTLNELLPAMTVDEVEVPLSASRTLRVQLEDLRVTRLDPATSGVHGSLTVRVPSMGLAVPVEPRMSLHAMPGSGSSIELRFQEVALKLPLLSSVNLASAIPPLQFPADSVFLVDGTRGQVRVTSQLADLSLSPRAVHLRFDVAAQAIERP